MPDDRGGGDPLVLRAVLLAIALPWRLAALFFAAAAR
jgi:hypothetical protein